MITPIWADIRNLPIQKAINPSTRKEFSFIKLQTVDQAEEIFNLIKFKLATVCAEIFRHTHPYGPEPRVAWDLEWVYSQISNAFFKTIACNIDKKLQTYSDYVNAPRIYIDLPEGITQEDLIRLEFSGVSDFITPDKLNPGTVVCPIPGYLVYILYPLLQIECLFTHSKCKLCYLSNFDMTRGLLTYGLRVPKSSPQSEINQ